MADPRSRCRLCLVAPRPAEAVHAATLLREALDGGDVAAIIVIGDPTEPARFQEFAAHTVATASPRDVATLVANDTRIAGRVRADGVHIDTGIVEVAAAVANASGKRMVGAGGIRSRHDAMELGEAGPDYLFFGVLDGDRQPQIFPRAIALASWWSDVAVIPAMVMGGSALASVEEAAHAGVDFVALRDAVWTDPRGPAAAVAEANERLASTRQAAA
jgi:thiamine-phosphate pyrophosphorylase